jgi:hypothetical protein
MGMMMGHQEAFASREHMSFPIDHKGSLAHEDGALLGLEIAPLYDEIFCSFVRLLF